MTVRSSRTNPDMRRISCCIFSGNVEPGREVQHRVDTVAIDGSNNQFIHYCRAHYHGPRKLSTPLHRSHDFLATGSGQFPRIRIAEERVAPLGLHGAVGCHPAGGI